MDAIRMTISEQRIKNTAILNSSYKSNWDKTKYELYFDLSYHPKEKFMRVVSKHVGERNEQINEKQTINRILRNKQTFY